MSDTSLYVPVLQERGKWMDYRAGVWGNSYTWYRDRSWDAIKNVVIHHSVTQPTDDPKGDVDYIAQLHKQRGWDGIGYHFVITADGMVWYVGDIGQQRACVADKNDFVICICLVGDFTKYNPTDEQILSAHDLSKFLIFEMPQLTSMNNWEDALKGHQDMQATQCPGSSWNAEEGGSMKWRIQTRTPYTPQPVPEPDIDWEKAYNELKIECDYSKMALEDDKNACLSEKSQLEGKLAECEADCQKKIDAIEESYDYNISELVKKEYLSNQKTSDLIKEILGRLSWRK